MKVTTRSHIVPLAIIAVAVLQAPVSGQEAWNADLAVVLVNERDQTSTPLESGQVLFETRATRVEADDTIDGLLRDYGLFPDAEAYGAVYRLNPGLTSLSAAGEEDLLLPRVVGDDDVLGSLAEGSLIAVTLDVTMKLQLREQAATLRTMFADLTMDSEAAGAVRASVDAIVAFDAVIRERSLPLNADILSQVTTGAEVLESLLSSSQVGTELDAADRATLLELAEDLPLLADNLAAARVPGEPPRPYPEVEVVVKVVGVDGTEVSNLRVYHVWRAYYGKEAYYKTFADLTSPSAGRLLVANYRIWAAAPGNLAPVTEVLRLDVRVPAGGGPVNVKLAVPQ